MLPRSGVLRTSWAGGDRRFIHPPDAAATARPTSLASASAPLRGPRRAAPESRSCPAGTALRARGGISPTTRSSCSAMTSEITILSWAVPAPSVQRPSAGARVKAASPPNRPISSRGFARMPQAEPPALVVEEREKDLHEPHRRSGTSLSPRRSIKD
jgi:hypothetical protein